MAGGAAHDAIRNEFGTGFVDRQLDERGELYDAEVMTSYALDDGTWLVSYEYYVEHEYFVGYAPVPARLGRTWSLGTDIEIDVDAYKPDRSRPRGTRRAPLAWVTHGIVRWRTISGMLAVVGVLAGLAAVAWGLTRGWRRG